MNWNCAPMDYTAISFEMLEAIMQASVLIALCLTTCRYQTGLAAVSVLHLQYRGIECLQNLEVCVDPHLRVPC